MSVYAHIAPLRLIVSVPPVGCSCRRLPPVAYSLTLYLKRSRRPLAFIIKVVLPRISVGRIGTGDCFGRQRQCVTLTTANLKLGLATDGQGLNLASKIVNAVVEMTSPQIKKVGAAMTMTPHSHALLAEASRFAERLGAPLTLIHTGTSEAQSQAYLHEAAKHLAISHEKNIVLESSLLKPC
jgi:hypothetical protein